MIRYGRPVSSPFMSRVLHTMIAKLSRTSPRSSHAFLDLSNDMFVHGSVALADALPGGEDAEVKRHCRVGPSGQVSSGFAGFRFPPEVILLAVRWYLRFGLSYRDLEELLAARAHRNSPVVLGETPDPTSADTALRLSGSRQDVMRSIRALRRLPYVNDPEGTATALGRTFWSGQTVGADDPLQILTLPPGGFEPLPLTCDQEPSVRGSRRAAATSPVIEVAVNGFSCRRPPHMSRRPAAALRQRQQQPTCKSRNKIGGLQ